jgi:NADPH:quinone reductase-like Zn-dependent oxidoreductase
LRAFEIQGAFGLPNLKLAGRPDPLPGPGEVLLAPRAVSLNRRDVLFVEGSYYPKQKLPAIPCSDASCEVLAVGEGVTAARPGDRVMPIFAQRWLAGGPTREKLASTLGGPRDGTLAERMVLHESGVVPVPAHLSHEEAATLPCAALTAWCALVELGALKAGDTVLLQGTGGVSIFALQLAVLQGARVIVTSRSAHKLVRARELGAAETIDVVETPDWEKRARELTAGTGVDHVVDVGGAGTLTRSVRAVRPGGTVSIIGVLGGPVLDFGVLPVLMQQLRLQGVIVGSRESFLAMNRAVSQHGLRPVVDRVFPFEEAPLALEYMKSDRHLGKIVIGVP